MDTRTFAAFEADARADGEPHAERDGDEGATRWAVRRHAP